MKFVIGDRADYEWSKAKIAEYDISAKSPVLLSVVFGKLEPVVLSEWILEDKIDVRFQLQMHKYIWNPEKRGV